MKGRLEHTNPAPVYWFSGMLWTAVISGYFQSQPEELTDQLGLQSFAHLGMAHFVPSLVCAAILWASFHTLYSLVTGRAKYMRGLYWGLGALYLALCELWSEDIKLHTAFVVAAKGHPEAIALWLFEQIILWSVFDYLCNLFTALRRSRLLPAPVILAVKNRSISRKR